MNNVMYSRGNLVLSDDEGHSIYEDGAPFDDTRPCAKCGIAVAEDEPDPCLGWLDGVDFACCGHGDTHHEYVLVGDKRYDSVKDWRASIH